MKYVAAAILATLTTPCIAQDFPPLHSRWRNPQNPGSCLEITGISEPLPGSNACVQVSGSVKRANSVQASSAVTPAQEVDDQSILRDGK